MATLPLPVPQYIDGFNVQKRYNLYKTIVTKYPNRAYDPLLLYGDIELEYERLLNAGLITGGGAGSGGISLWAPSTAYTAGQQVISPNNDIVSATTSFTSGTTYSAANWTLSPTFLLTSASANFVAVTAKGAANGVATLDSGTHIPLAQIPTIPSAVQAVIVVTGSEARPVGVTTVIWVGGTTRPVNCIAGDIWLKAGS
jgi:hypothetical protein